ncbi:hypothetical protein FRC12_013048 [Ceratobasidium sp. 428]|nr:hypothetical protein FRC12_013048 [Ceratobasidium sp. 428]
MKELVVERSSDQLKVSSSRMGDSDDEDDTIEGEDDASQEESDAEVPAGALRPSEVSESESDDGEAEAAAGIDETDFDEAMLQREIALAYYARRNQIGSDVTSGPLFDSAEVDRISSDNDVDDLRSDMDKSTSHFRCSRLNGDPQALINSAVQFGKLVDGQLVAGQVADREVEASLDELTGGSSDPNKEDLTEKTIALLMHSGKAFQGQPTNPLLHSQHAHPQVSSSSATSSFSRSVVAPQPQPTPNPKSQPQPPTVPVISSTNKQKSTQPPGSIPAATSQAFPPMIIESGFGFDPAFQVAPKPRTAAAKTITPMSETVKERSSAPIPHPAAREQAKSRFAQASRTRGAKSQLSPATPNAETSATALRGDVIERAAPESRVQPPEPSKRISRFRAERAGYL